jgi:hypothetical protein
MIAIVAMSFIYAPLSGVVPSWLGFDDGPFQCHLDHVWQGTKDQHHHAHDLNGGDENQDLFETANLQMHEEQSAFDDERNAPHSHAPHMHFIDVMDCAFTLLTPIFSREQVKISEGQQPEYLFPVPLLKPPQSDA